MPETLTIETPTTAGTGVPITATGLRQALQAVHPLDSDKPRSVDERVIFGALNAVLRGLQARDAASAYNPRDPEGLCR